MYPSAITLLIFIQLCFLYELIDDFCPSICCLCEFYSAHTINLFAQYVSD